MAPAIGDGKSPEPSKRRSNTLRWAANIGYAVVLMVMALLPSRSIVTDLAPPDWIAHAVAYGIQAALVYWASLPSLGRTRSLVVGAVTASVFGALTECLQLLQPGRSVEFKDLIANTTGALLMCGIIAGARRFGSGARI